MARMMAASMINTDFIRKHPAQAVLTVLGLSGVVLVFLPFTENVLPIVFVLQPTPLPPFRGILNFGSVYWFAVPFVVLPFAISAGYLRWLLTGRLSRRVAAADYALALIAACVLVLVILVDWLDSIACKELYSPGWCRDPFMALVPWQSVAYPLVAFSAGAGFVIQNVRNATRSGPNALVAMQVVYLPLALFLILGGLDGPQIGCYLTIVPVLAYSAQIVMAAKRLWQALIFFVPFGLVWGVLVWGGSVA